MNNKTSIIIAILCSMAAMLVCGTPHALAQGKKKNTSFNVGQNYVGGHAGAAIPLGLGAGGSDKIGFNNVAKTGFAIFADGMRQMNQAIGLGAEVGFRNYAFNDEGLWAGLNRGSNQTFEAAYRQIDFGLTGRVFIGGKALRPFVGVSAGGAVLLNSLDYESKTKSYSYKTNNLSASYGVMSGIYFKAGKRTLLSAQVRLNIVPNLKDGDVDVYNPETHTTEKTRQNVQANQNNLMVTIGMHVGTQKNNKH